MGLILDRNNIGTCFHIVDDSIPKSRIDVFYNFRRNDFHSPLRYDSTTVDFNSTAYKKAVASSKYDKGNICSDYIILPIKKKVVFTPPQFSTLDIKMDDVFYTSGPGSGRYYPIHINALFSFKPYEDQECELVAFYGYADHGFSGAPVYAVDGQVVGIIQSGHDSFNENYFIKMLESGFISQQKFDIMKNIYSEKSGAKVAYFIRIKSVLNAKYQKLYSIK